MLELVKQQVLEQLSARGQSVGLSSVKQYWMKVSKMSLILEMRMRQTMGKCQWALVCSKMILFTVQVD